MLYALRDCANLQVRSNTDNKVKLYADYARTSTIEFTSDQIFARNKTTRAVRWDTERQGTFRTTFEVFNMDMIAMLFGQELVKGNVEFAKREVVEVKSGSATLKGTPKTGTLLVYKVDPTDKLTHLEEQTVGATSSANKYSISGQTLTFNTTETFKEDGYVACYYMVDTDVKKFTVDNISFPGGYHIYGDTFIRGTDQVDIPVQFELLNVKPQSNVTLTMDVENVATIEVTWDVMADATGTMMEWRQIDE